MAFRPGALWFRLPLPSLSCPFEPVHKDIWTVLICVYLTQEPGRSQNPGSGSPVLHFFIGPADKWVLNDAAPNSLLSLYPSPEAEPCAPSFVLLQYLVSQNSCLYSTFSWQSTCTYIHVFDAHKSVKCVLIIIISHPLPRDSIAWWFKRVGSTAGMLGLESSLYHLLAV